MSKNAFFVATLVMSLSVFASDEKHEEKKEETTLSESARAVKELMDIEKQVSTLAAKVNAKETAINGLLKQKQIEKDTEKVSEIIKLLQTEHREWSGLVQEYNSQLNVLKYRFPERGAMFDRKYKRFNAKTLDQMEQSAGIEKQLYQGREKVKRIYGVDKNSKQFKEDQKKDRPQSESLLKPTTISK